MQVAGLARENHHLGALVGPDGRSQVSVDHAHVGMRSSDRGRRVGVTSVQRHVVDAEPVDRPSSGRGSVPACLDADDVLLWAEAQQALEA